VSEPLRAATGDDLAGVTAVLTDAFLDDPLMQWVFDDAVRAERLTALWRFMAGEGYLPRGTSSVIATDDGSIDAVALWLAPGVELDEAFWNERLGDFLVALEADIDRLGMMSDVMGQHHPTEPHWYLLAIAASPTLHGRGLGSALLAHTLARADAERAPAYLEATSRRSRLLYERFGFEVIGEFTPADGPPLWGMWREPAGV
jgi:ribosomal protein S18 acetylase RimI-like enzyme